jgi:hypothetical protein
MVQWEQEGCTYPAIMNMNIMMLGQSFHSNFADLRSSNGAGYKQQQAQQSIIIHNHS